MDEMDAHLHGGIRSMATGGGGATPASGHDRLRSTVANARNARCKWRPTSAFMNWEHPAPGGPVRSVQSQIDCYPPMCDISTLRAREVAAVRSSE
jgi:hypothetical protein